MTLRETVEDPSNFELAYIFSMTIDFKSMQFVNLNGLLNNALLLSVRLRESFCAAKGKSKVPYKEKYTGFSAYPFRSKLYNELYLCNWSQQLLELTMPMERIQGWKTVGLILKTFDRISAENWCHLVGIKKTRTPPVAGLDWMAVERDVVPETRAPVPVPMPIPTPEEEKKMRMLLEIKKARIAALREIIRMSH
ncbi:hypothetical protein BJX99DRAFT_260646 [Aspergillus californicus]